MWTEGGDPAAIVEGTRPHPGHRSWAPSRRRSTGHRRQSRQGRAGEGEAGAGRLVRRPGDEGDRRQSEPASRQRSGQGEARDRVAPDRHDPRDPRACLWRTRRPQMGGGRGRRAWPRRGQDQADGDRAQLYRRLFRTGFYPQPSLPVHPRHGRRRRRHRGRRGRAGLKVGAPRRLCRADRRLCRGAADRGRPRGQDPAGDQRRDRGRDHAQGHDGAISAAADLQGRAATRRFCSMPRPAASG